MVATISIDSGCGLRNEVHRRNQPKKISYVELYKPLAISFTFSHLNSWRHTTQVNKREHFNYKGGCGV